MHNIKRVEWAVNKQRLLRAAMDGDWGAAKEILDRDRDLRTARIDYEGMTALHLAARCGRSEFVEEFVSILRPRELEMVDQGGNNVLHHAAVASDVRTAQAIAQKNRRLARVENWENFTPLFFAARWRHPSKSKEMLEFLSSITPKSVYKAETAGALIVAITTSGCHGKPRPLACELYMYMNPLNLYFSDSFLYYSLAPSHNFCCFLENVQFMCCDINKKEMNKSLLFEGRERTG